MPLRLLTTLTSFATAVDVTLAELHLEAFLPADAATADLLRRRAAATPAWPGRTAAAVRRWGAGCAYGPG